MCVIFIHESRLTLNVTEAPSIISGFSEISCYSGIGGPCFEAKLGRLNIPCFDTRTGRPNVPLFDEKQGDRIFRLEKKKTACVVQTVLGILLLFG
jgi:hypothetical protein